MDKKVVKILKVVKADQTVHFVPLAAKAQVQAQNNLLNAHQKWTITEVDESERLKHNWKDKTAVTGPAVEVIAAKDKEIEKLRAQLKAAAKGGEAAKPDKTGEDTPLGETEKSTSLKAELAIDKINALTNEADINAFIEGETRVTVVKAATTKIESLTV